MSHQDQWSKVPDVPLSLQMGSVTGAVDDLMQGYSALVESLPALATRVSKMTLNTEGMAKELEVNCKMSE